MLVELRAENYAVIDHAIAVFGPGLNLLTGETGAGKSILVDALALLMGGKSSVEVVRHGADKAVVACVFESTPGPRPSSKKTASTRKATRSSCAARFSPRARGASL
jgi:DNA repair ATPase RecN